MPMTDAVGGTEGPAVDGEVDDFFHVWVKVVFLFANIVKIFGYTGVRRVVFSVRFGYINTKKAPFRAFFCSTLSMSIS